jgi:hypothetical protein
METAKDIFFFIGATLGMLAFFKTLLEPALNKNREKWKKVFEVVTDVDFQSVEHGTSSYLVRGKNLQRIECLVQDYYQKADYTQFNALLSNIYTEYFRELVAAHSEYRELVQVNEWLPDENGDWRFNKMAFAGEDRIPRNYHKHIFKAEIAAEKMRHSFKKLEALSDLELWQIPFARKFVAKRIPPLLKELLNPVVNRDAAQ